MTNATQELKPIGMTVRQYAQVMGKSTRHVQRLIDAGQLPAIREKGCRKWIIPHGAIKLETGGKHANG